MTETAPTHFSEVRHLIHSPAPAPRSVNPYVWLITCPNCHDEEATLVRSDGRVSITCGDPDCSEAEIAESLGLTVAELTDLRDDVVLTPGPP